MDPELEKKIRNETGKERDESGNRYTQHGTTDPTAF
jgi:hypothetical protein